MTILPHFSSPHRRANYSLHNTEYQSGAPNSSWGFKLHHSNGSEGRLKYDGIRCTELRMQSTDRFNNRCCRLSNNRSKSTISINEWQLWQNWSNICHSCTRVRWLWEGLRPRSSCRLNRRCGTHPSHACLSRVPCSSTTSTTSSTWREASLHEVGPLSF